MRLASYRFVLFGGKGGVGKTTMATAAAIRLAGEGKTLLFTTDPAPSLADSLGQRIDSEPTPVSGVSDLFAMEIDAQKVLDEFKAQYRRNILSILEQGTYLDDDEIEDLFRLDIPGMDEVMSLKKIIDLMEQADYRRYIVDTAPSGHTLRLLMLPDLLDNWIKFLAQLRWKYHTIARQFGGSERIEQADAFLLEMKKTVRRVRALLQNHEKTEFVVVTIAEKMAVAETADLLRSLRSIHIPSRHIIINNIFPRDGSAFAAQRRQMQENYIQAIHEQFRDHLIIHVPLQPGEVQGVESLRSIGELLS
jgi:arsenite-transporting ATPase